MAKKKKTTEVVLSFDNMTNDEIIMHWLNSLKPLTNAKSVESTLRDEVIKRFFSPDSTGSVYHELGNGYQLKGQFNLTRSVTEDNDAVNRMLQLLVQAGPEGYDIAVKVIVFKAHLVSAIYNQVPEPYKSIIDSVVTTKPNSPSLEFIEPKKE
jgi:hypothetical protein